VIIKRGITHRINQGNYEYVEITGAVEAEDTEFLSAENFFEETQRILDKLLAPDIEEARRALADDADFTSYITEWKAGGN
jgi:hypothetical protein